MEENKVIESGIEDVAENGFEVLKDSNGNGLVIIGALGGLALAAGIGLACKKLKPAIRKFKADRNAKKYEKIEDLDAEIIDVEPSEASSDKSKK